MNNKPIKILTKYIFFLILINFPKANDVNWIGNLRYRILQDKNSAEDATSSLSEMRSRFGFSMGFGKTFKAVG